MERLQYSLFLILSFLFITNNHAVNFLTPNVDSKLKHEDLISFAAEAKQVSLLEELLSRGIERNTLNIALKKTCAKTLDPSERNRIGAQLLLQYGADVNCYTENDVPLLIEVVDAGDYWFADLFLNYKAQVDLSEKYSGKTPLFIAVERFSDNKYLYLSIINLLLKYNANPLIKNKQGMSALDFAKTKKLTALVPKLEKAAQECLRSNREKIAEKVECFLRSTGRKQLLCNDMKDLVFYKEYNVVLQYMLESKLFPIPLGTLNNAIWAENIQAVDLLLRHGADVNEQLAHCLPTLRASLGVKKLGILKLLLDHGAHPRSDDISFCSRNLGIDPDFYSAALKLLQEKKD